MPEFKDLFSPQAGDYAKFRPHYPKDLFEWITAQAAARELAIDLGCGNGQATAALIPRFRQAIGVDPSQAQLDQAPKWPHLRYVCAAAEATGLEGGLADAVTVAQAFHWFKTPEVFAEMQRLLKPGGLVALWAYRLNKVTPAVDAIVWKLYEDLLGKYWEPERKLVMDGYANVEFPAGWTELAAPDFGMREDWSFERYAGYLGTWSPLKRFREREGYDPLERTLPELKRAWGRDDLAVDWPLKLRAFRLP
jgi:SAM-dependent methyltransferase